MLCKNNGVTLKWGLGGHSRSLEVAPFHWLRLRVPYTVSQKVSALMLDRFSKFFHRLIRKKILCPCRIIVTVFGIEKL